MLADSLLSLSTSKKEEGTVLFHRSGLGPNFVYLLLSFLSSPFSLAFFLPSVPSFLPFKGSISPHGLELMTTMLQSLQKPQKNWLTR